MNEIELLKYAVSLFDGCDEAVTQRFTAEQLLLIANVCKLSGWNIPPDQWTEQQANYWFLKAKDAERTVPPAPIEYWHSGQLKKILLPIYHHHKGTYNTWRHGGKGKKQLGVIEAMDQLVELVEDVFTEDDRRVK